MNSLQHVSFGLKMLAYDRYSPKKQEKIQKKRLKKLVNYARTNSPYFAELYKSIGEDFDITELPPTSKQVLMNNFDDWCTDRNVTLTDVTEFMSDLNNMGEKYCGKYMLASTSGSTGMPAFLVQDDSFLALNATLSFWRYFKMKMPLANVSADDGYGVDNVSVHQYHSFAKIIDKIARLIDATLPAEEIIKQLNDYQPKIITGYPSTFLLLAEPEIKSKSQLHIKPHAVYCGGEYLSAGARQTLVDLFKAPVYSIYGCTEGGAMAFECQEQHLHPNSDWMILEPVDANYQPVKSGERAEKVLLTNLMTFPQPIIRYELTDRVVAHYEGCACGKSGLWLEPEGRTSDILRFEADGQVISVSPMSLIAPLEDTPGMGVFQLVVHPHNQIEMRISVLEGYDRQEVFSTSRHSLCKYIEMYGVKEFAISLSDKYPEKDKISGKFKQFIQADD